MKMLSVCWKWNRNAAICAIGMALAGLPARGQSIPIVNASFEDGVSAGQAGAGFAPIFGWTLSGGGAGSSRTLNRIPSQWTEPANDGTVIGGLVANGTLPGISQVLGATLTEGTTYVLSVDFYQGTPLNPCSICPPIVFVSGFSHDVSLALRAGGSVLAALTLPPNSLAGQTDPTRTVVFTAAPGDPHLGQPLEIAISFLATGSDFTSEIFFDNVRLTAFPPGSLQFSFGGVDATPTSDVALSMICVLVPCQGTLEFHDPRGVLVSQQPVNLPPGGQTSFSLPPESKRSGPMQVTPGWFLTVGSAIASLEVDEPNREDEHPYVNWGDGSIAQAGKLQFGPVGITRGQTARLHGYCNIPPPVNDRPAACQSTFEFHDVNGRVLKQAIMTLQPGTGGSLDLSFNAMNVPGRRLEFVPSVTVTGGMGVASLAVLDSDGTVITQSYPAKLVSGRLS